MRAAFFAKRINDAKHCPCWEQRGLLSLHCRAFVSRTHLALLPQSQFATVPRPSAESWKEAAVSHNPALTQRCYPISYAQLGLGMVLSASGMPTQEICENGSRSRKSGSLCFYYFARSCYLNRLFHLEALCGMRDVSWGHRADVEVPICGFLLIQGASNRLLCTEFANLTPQLLKSSIWEL